MMKLNCVVLWLMKVIRFASVLNWLLCVDICIGWLFISRFTNCMSTIFSVLGSWFSVCMVVLICGT